MPSEKVQVVSGAAPDLRRVEKGNSEGTPTIKLASMVNLDTSNMKRVEFAKLKLRQWKAKLLAEPPPVVEVEFKSLELNGASRMSLRPALPRRALYLNWDLRRKVSKIREISCRKRQNSNTVAKREFLMLRKRSSHHHYLRPLRTALRHPPRCIEILVFSPIALVED